MMSTQRKLMQGHRAAGDATTTAARGTAVPHGRFTWRGHVAITRPDHWFKNLFVLPGVAVALLLNPASPASDWIVDGLVAALAICLTASSYYTLNELLDAKHDLLHPEKRTRPVPAGQVNRAVGYVQWLLLGAVSLAIGAWVNNSYGLVLGALWCMGIVYNVPPLRAKDTPYLDVLSEALNNPLRMLAGWYVVTETAIPPASLLISYWMIGGFFMALKRHAEYRSIGDASAAAAYRRSFRFYTPDRLLVFAAFLLALSMSCFGVFVVRYRLELVFALPLMALVVAEYLRIGLQADSPVQRPEELYREPRLMLVVSACALVTGFLMWWDVPDVHEWLKPFSSTSR